MKYLKALLENDPGLIKPQTPPGKELPKPPKDLLSVLSVGDPKGLGQISGSAEAGADPFREGFGAIYEKLTANGGRWETTGYREPIWKDLERMDAAWVRRDLPGFQAAIQEIERLVGLASDRQT